MRYVLAVCLAAGCLGCNDRNPFSYVPVSGRLTYDDGTPIPAGGIRLSFEAIDAQPVNGAFPRPGEAEVDSQGNFSKATSYKYGDGLLPGKHKVAIYYATDKEGKLLIPKEYSHASTSPLIADTDNLPLEIKVPRP